MRQVLLPGDLFSRADWLWSSAPRKNIPGGAGPVVVGFSSRGCVWVGMGRAGGALPSTSQAHTHTKLLSVTTRCSISLGSRVEPSPRVGRARELPAARTRTYFYTNTDLYFQFSKRLCFHLKRCCLLLFDLNQMKANRIQMKYVCVLILHKESLLRAARGCSGSGLGV